MGRGVLPDTHPLCFESSLAIRPGSALYASGNTDLVVILGSRLSLFNIFGGIYNQNASILQVDICPEELGRNRSVDVPVIGDVKAFIKQCNAILDEKKIDDKLTKKFKPWISELVKADEDSKNMANINWTSDSVPVHPMRLAMEVNNFMDKDDDIVIADGGIPQPGTE
jgi:acetolactate synthase-1/2/3 large subunit